MKDTSLDRSAIGSIGRRPLSERVCDALKAAIINGALPPDTKLTETEVARKMAVSPTPVREAFRRLAAEGFVAIAPWRGVRVQGFSEREIAETYQCREPLEGLAGRLAAANIDAAGIENLRALLAAERKARTGSAVEELNTAFHAVIYSYARNSKLTSLLVLFHDIILRDRVLTGHSPRRRHEIQAEHTRMADALAARDGEAAEQACRFHVQQAFAYRLAQRPGHGKRPPLRGVSDTGREAVVVMPDRDGAPGEDTGASSSRTRRNRVGRSK
jgi:DNA-binding GntR family transcriptional regulator